MFEKKILSGEVVIKQGDPGDYFYVIDHGNFDVFINDERKAEYLGEGAFGELALMYNTPRAATIQATSNAIVWAVDRQTFRKAISHHNYRKRKMYETFIKGIPILGSLSATQISRVADCLEPVEYRKGDVIIHQGDEGDSFYVVVEGHAQITIAKDGKEADAGTIGPGDYFGEIALIKKCPRAATITALTQIKCVTLDTKAFDRVFGPLLDILKRNMTEYKKYEELIRAT